MFWRSSHIQYFRKLLKHLWASFPYEEPAAIVHLERKVRLQPCARKWTFAESYGRTNLQLVSEGRFGKENVIGSLTRRSVSRCITALTPTLSRAAFAASA